MPEQEQITDTLIMVRPARFGYNPETANSNSFQASPAVDIDHEKLHEVARSEFDGMVRKLDDHGIRVIVADDEPEPPKPDAVFPNNWFSTHADGTLVLYPMMAEVRRKERSDGLIARLARDFNAGDILDLTDYEREGKFLEGTGSIVFDHIHRIAFACRSPRTEPAVLETLCSHLGYTPFVFDAADKQGQPVYHTNVILAIGEQRAIVCLASVRDAEQRDTLVSMLKSGGRNIVDISMEQTERFAGNALLIRTPGGKRYWVMSSTAKQSLLPHQIAMIEGEALILDVTIPLIEKLGGGSARCMMAECFFPVR